jgi:hypothetical protein
MKTMKNSVKMARLRFEAGTSKCEAEILVILS